MYVKVTHGDRMGGDFIVAVTGPLHSGTVALPFEEDAVDIDFGAGLAWVLGEAMLPKTPDDGIQAMPFNHTHVLEVDPDQTRFERQAGLVAVRYVWWDEPGDGLHAVVTTRNIFIVGDNGKTIDRVR